MATRWGQAVPLSVVEWDMAEATGWTLEYINSLPLARLHEWLSIRDGRGKARQSARRPNA